MRVLVLLSSLLAAVFAQSALLKSDGSNCLTDPNPVFKNQVLLPFTKHLASEASFHSRGNFVISTPSIWLSLASLADSADYREEHREMWNNSLHFPKSQCVRDQFYKIALTLESSAPGLEFRGHRALAIANTAEVQKDWIEFSHNTGLLSYLSVQYDDAHFGRVQDYMGIVPKIPLAGNSVFLDHLVWTGLWTSAFAENKVTIAPFYNGKGKEIAQVEYLRTKRKVRVADIPNANIQVVELPVGSDGRYSMILAVGAEPKALIETVFNVDILSKLVPTEKPVDVAIPRLDMDSALNLRPDLSHIGLEKLFTNPEFSSHVSQPAALPGAYLHRVSINVTGSLGNANDKGLIGTVIGGIEDTFSKYLSAFNNKSVGHYHFIANRPFLFSLFENKFGVPIFTGVYSYPGKRGSQ